MEEKKVIWITGASSGIGKAELSPEIPEPTTAIFI
jgi:NADP-dependent 3-hydroxy acid dehydrogenase YdfG